MATISTHVLDAATGQPAHGVLVSLERLEPGDTRWVRIGAAATGPDGRIRNWGSDVTPDPAHYRLCFATGAWFAEAGRECFYPEVMITFSVRDDDGHFHVPLLLAPFAYSTYRGS